jgi:arsenate reductase (thioredoxin)
MKTVLFICVHNSARSQMAEAFFNLYARGRAMAISAGTQPSTAVNPMVVELMREAGIDLGAKKPRLLDYTMLEQADRVISMGCGVDAACPARLVPVEDWALVDPTGKTPREGRAIRDEIERRVLELLAELGISREH